MSTRKRKPLSISDLDGAAQIFVLSNTPFYLFKHLRQDGFVENLGRNTDTAELIELVRRYAGTWKKRPEAIVAAYACLTALSFRPQSEYKEFIEGFSSPQLRWLPEISSLLLQPQIATSRVFLPAPVIRDSGRHQSQTESQNVSGLLLPASITH